MKINNTEINENSRTYIIAELSANHEQNYDLAEETIRAMKQSGADAVKLQTYTPDSMTLDSDKPWFQTRNDSLWAGQKMYDLYKKGETPWEWHKPLKKLAESLEMDFFSSPFDLKSVNLLESIDVPAYKIASLEITDIPLIKKCAETGKPIIISTGAARIEDIDLAVKTCLDAGNNKIALLKCTSAYPTPYNEVNLKQIQSLKERYNIVVGLSDHTLGTEVPIASVVMGAKIIEKHFILSRNSNGLDKDFSLEPQEFKQMTDAIRNIEQAIGNGSFDLTSKIETATKFRRSLFVSADMKKGEIFTENNIKSVRPGLGLHPKYYYEILGKRATKDIEKGEPLSFEDIADM
ncbi:MAG: pseudaminic acid synthase [Chlorobi bacterium]|nr:pseudaminic acid synthase [Chlorobiota bacterium]